MTCKWGLYCHAYNTLLIIQDKMLASPLKINSILMFFQTFFSDSKTEVKVYQFTSKSQKTLGNK